MNSLQKHEGDVAVLASLGKYQIKRELGRGAMGVVYEGFDPLIERTVAIKTILKSQFHQTELDELLGRFRREAQAAGRLNHPNIVTIYEYGEEGDVAYIAMEYITGTELKEHFDQAENFQIGNAASIMLQLLDALEYSHNRGVVHRDIKPSNILITQDGKIKIADFGIARIESSELTQAGTVLGTPSYMSPEQFLGKEADRRSDIYSTGVILYQMLTGRRPFIGGNLTEIMNKVVSQAAAVPSSINPKVTKALDVVVAKAMAKRPEDRFQSAAAFAAALKLAADIVAIAERKQRPEATLKVTGREQSVPEGTIESALQFNLDDIDKRLAETRREVETGKYVVPEYEDQTEIKLKLDLNESENETTVVLSPKAEAPVQTGKQDEPPMSGLLAGLAQEAQQKQVVQYSAEVEKQAKAQRIHAALESLIKFFNAFNKHVNSVAPQISRVYSLDARVVYRNLKWQNARLDLRKQGLSDLALYDYVTFSVNLHSPDPIVLKRPWSQYEATKSEIKHLMLNTIDDLIEVGRNIKQEWLEVNMSPDILVQLKFQGNYEQGCIDVAARNIESFGATSFRLKPEDVTQKMLDELGLYLLGRSNKLPVALQRI